VTRGIYYINVKIFDKNPSELMTQRDFYNGISAHPKAMMGKISHLLYIQNSSQMRKPALNSTPPGVPDPREHLSPA
jgi:hypothetical protein